MSTRLSSSTGLQTDRLTVGYSGRRVIGGVSVDVPPGSTLAIIGRSGVGKSTLIGALAGLIEPVSGTVSVAGEPLTGPDRRIGVVMQTYGLFPWFTARRNVELGLGIRDRQRGSRARASRRETASAALARVGLAGLEDAYPRRLSGGEQQRIALARALVLDPTVLLLDEPFSSLDALTREGLQDLLRELLDATLVSTVIVTHSIEEAVYLGHTVGALCGEPAELHLTAGLACAASQPADRSRDDLRTDPAYLEACARVRRWFRERVDA